MRYSFFNGVFYVKPNMKSARGKNYFPRRIFDQLETSKYVSLLFKLVIICAVLFRSIIAINNFRRIDIHV